MGRTKNTDWRGPAADRPELHVQSLLAAEQ